MLSNTTRRGYGLAGLLLGIWLLPGPAAKALAGRAAQENYTARVWQVKDGLPQQTVQAMAQTQDGFLWIGTAGGLLRFDGSRFITFDRANTPVFEENSIFSLTTASDGTLWIGTEGGGLIRMRGGEFRHFGATEGLLDGFVRSIVEDRDGAIWIGTDNGLFRLPAGEPPRVMRVDASATIPPMTVHAIARTGVVRAGIAGTGFAETGDDTVWVGGSRLLRLRNGVATDYPLAGEYSETTVKSILQTHDGTLWVGTVSGLQRLGKSGRRFEKFPGIRGTVRTLRETSDGTLWIGTIGQGLFTLRGGRVERLGSAEPNTLNLPSNTVLSLFDDSEHNLWLGTQAGVVRFSRSSVRLVPLPNTSDSDFGTISLDRDGSLWVASTGLTHVVNGVATPMVFPELHGARVRNVLRARDGALWIGTDGSGLFRLGKGAALHCTMKSGATSEAAGGPGIGAGTGAANGLVNNFVRGMLEAKNGDLWIATDGGISRLSRGVFTNYNVVDGLAYFSVRAMLEDRFGGLWFGTDRGVSHLVDGRFVQDAATRTLAGEKVWALHESANGTLWFGTPDHGLYRYVARQARMMHYGSEQGLASNSVYSILGDTRGRLWLSGASGVDAVAMADLEAVAANPRAGLPQRFIGVAEGGQLSPLYGGTQPSGAITAEDHAWFPSSRGPVEFLPEETGSTAPPKVFLDRVVADGRPLSQAGPVELGADNRNLEITYGSILLGPQDAVQFLYKLEPFETEWRFGSGRRVADYTNLPAGRYTFRVRAQDGSGHLTEESVRIVKRQYFFLTWWFLGCCAAAAAMLIWWLHRQKLRRVRSAFQAVLDERARLAREMHDTLIQGCAGVSLLLDACSLEAGANPAQSELLGYARTQLASAMDEARQAVWNLRGEETTDFGQTLAKLVERVNRSTAIDVQCRIDGKTYDFHATAIHEVGMASREAIYNALIHASPTQVVVRAHFGEQDFTLAVVDDGSGFESGRHVPDGHYGLLGIEERIRRLGGEVEVQSQRSRGTSVLIRLPRSAVCKPLRQTASAEARSMEEAVR